ncbi:helix-turn-helix domain-containing protein, partial [Virgisporangium aurantiacum]|uniref:helix-turn-helix domain-containing protein n=1 Tax=Virgisporangium aurantiacum TaxID=175570 RepID=UPI00194E8D39
MAVGSGAAQEPDFAALVAELAAFRDVRLHGQPSNRALAKAAGVSPSTIGDWLRGTYFPQQIDPLLALVNAVRLRADQAGLASDGEIAALLEPQRWLNAYQAEARRRADLTRGAFVAEQGRAALIDRAAFAEIIGLAAADALADWAKARNLTVEIAEPRLVSRGYTGSSFVLVIVLQSSRPARRLILRLHPEGWPPPVREVGFMDEYRVRMAFDPIAMSGGGFLVFEDIDPTDGTVETLAQVPDRHLPQACAALIRVLLRPQRVDTTSAMSFISLELGDRFQPPTGTGDALWITTDEDPGPPLPNPALMARGRTGSQITFHATFGAACGDLYPGNVLLPTGSDPRRFERFRLIDLAAYTPDAPLTRDPVDLILALATDALGSSSSAGRDALLEAVLRPDQAVAAPPSAAAIGAIYRAGLEIFKANGVGDDWRSQYLLSVLARALRRGGWWFFRLAAHAGRMFLEHHQSYEPGPAHHFRESETSFAYNGSPTVDSAGSLFAHTAQVHALTAVSGPDGRTLLASAGETVRLWDPVTGAAVGLPLTG